MRCPWLGSRINSWQCFTGKRPDGGWRPGFWLLPQPLRLCKPPHQPEGRPAHGSVKALSWQTVALTQAVSLAVVGSSRWRLYVNLDAMGWWWREWPTMYVKYSRYQEKHSKCYPSFLQVWMATNGFYITIENELPP